MLYTNIIAEVTSKLDPSGIFCIAAIPCLLIVLFAYSKGPWSGSCTCLTFFVIACFACGDMAGGPPYNIQENKVMIANITQSKMMVRPGGWALDEGNAMMIQTPAPDGLGTETLWVPDEEIMIVDGWKKMKSTGNSPHNYDIARPELLKDRDWSKPNSWVYSDWGHPDDYLYKNEDGDLVKVNTGKPPTDDDYYYWDRTIDPINAPTEAGGYGVPQWLYHPAAPVYIFGLGGLPALLGGMFIASRLRDNNMTTHNKPKFKLGKIVITPGAIDALSKSNQLPDSFLNRHMFGDWGELCQEDTDLNNQAIANEGNIEKQQRVMSVYKTSKNETIWVITEWTREVTTILLPNEY